MSRRLRERSSELAKMNSLCEGLLKPSKNSLLLNFLLVKMGSITAVNNPAEDKQTKAIETLAYFMLP